MATDSTQHPRSGFPRSADRISYRPVQLDPNQAYSVVEAAAALGVSPAAGWLLVRSGELPTFMRGRRRLVLGQHIIARNLRDAGVQQ